MHQRAVSDFLKLRRFHVAPSDCGYTLKCEAQPTGHQDFASLKRECEDARHVAQLFESLIEQHIWNCPQDVSMLNQWRSEFASWYRKPDSELHFHDEESEPFRLQIVPLRC